MTGWLIAALVLTGVVALVALALVALLAVTLKQAVASLRGLEAAWCARPELPWPPAGARLVDGELQWPEPEKK